MNHDRGGRARGGRDTEAGASGQRRPAAHQGEWTAALPPSSARAPDFTPQGRASSDGGHGRGKRCFLTTGAHRLGQPPFYPLLNCDL